MVILHQECLPKMEWLGFRLLFLVITVGAPVITCMC